ncbi:hypothetical protein M378DRAFT_26527 [Amanita muscaria Koide BX008]|uniref:Uncharacterized protein n=1 Tax=Amanita muscaria (strain Koide BX008) TaxID=946122 RepID=A0A0C2WUE2_AMAMK|nr:hypothetical protein M378DRAFT_26527 [Amanita muscaria Koide BX008]
MDPDCVMSDVEARHEPVVLDETMSDETIPSSPIKTIPLSLNELRTLTESMSFYSDQEEWKYRAGKAANDNSKWRALVSAVLVFTKFLLSTIAPQVEHFMTFPDTLAFARKLDDDRFKQWKEAVQKGVDNNDWTDLFRLLVQQHDDSFNSLRQKIQSLSDAYNTPFLGLSAKNFIDYLETVDYEVQLDQIRLYSKSVAVVQSSGTGKSRMLTETGNYIFTLPICLRQQNGTGYPPGDGEVVQFLNLTTNIRNRHISYRVHADIACFLAAAHETMLKWLKDIMEKEECADTTELRKRWHQRMEPEGPNREARQQFFNEVVERAKELAKDPKIMKSPNSDASGLPKERANPKAEAIAKRVGELYENFTKIPTENLMKYLSKLPGAENPPLCVTYFDEEVGLGDSYWALLRLLSHQDRSTRMWYVFMGTKARPSYLSPPSGNTNSLRLRDEIVELLPPYIGLGFDQHEIYKEKKEIITTMDHFQTIEHLAQYGRPLWSATLETVPPPVVIDSAVLKLTNTKSFSSEDKDLAFALSENKDLVFAVLSQRLSLDTVLTGSEAVELAHRSVSHHMRLLTGLTAKRDILYTHSPSEPILVLASAKLLYNRFDKKRLADVLSTLIKGLCSAGLVEKGLPGELFARTLLLIARDFTVLRDGVLDLLEPVCLLDYLDKLFGKAGNWANRADRRQFSDAFSKAYVNFTHWIVARDRLPNKPDKELLANLWARGAALQCCFNQESLGWLIPIYIFPDGTAGFDSNAKFDPSRLSAVFGQVKNKEAGDSKAEKAIGIPCDPDQPLPYLAILMELGTMSTYRETGSNMKLMFQSEKGKQPRYSISVRGASNDTYGILSEAGIEQEFGTLFKITALLPSSQNNMIQHMCPLQQFSDGYIAWMDKYGVGKTPGAQ